MLGPVQDARHELPGAGAPGVIDDRVHRVKPFLCLGSVSEVDSMSLRLQAHAPVRY